jgi:hypothetical protein
MNANTFNKGWCKFTRWGVSPHSGNSLSTIDYVYLHDELS